MQPLSLDALLPLTCTHSGSCCHGHRIGITPWEIAILAQHMGLRPGEVRDRFTRAGGTLLRFDAPMGTGSSTCTFFRDSEGCAVHPARPLACRVYPLARRRDADRSFYTFAGDSHPCRTRCPTVETLPFQKVGDWLAQQQVGPGQSAHDAYGNLVWGMIITSAQIAAAGNLDPDALMVEGARRVALDGDERIPLLPPPWYDLLTIPELPVALDDAATFVGSHAQRLQQAIGSSFALPPTLAETVLLILTMAIHLAPCVGIDPAAVVTAFAAQVRDRSLVPAS